MKTKSVKSRLSCYVSVIDEKGHTHYLSRTHANRSVELIDQDGTAVCFPIITEPDGSKRIIYHPNTIKSLISFLKGE